MTLQAELIRVKLVRDWFVDAFTCAACGREIEPDESKRNDGFCDKCMTDYEELDD